MSDAQKFNSRLAEMLHNFIAPGSRAPSPVPSHCNNVHDAGSQRSKAIAANVSNASLASATVSLSHEDVNITANRPSIVIGTAMDQIPDVAQDSEGQPVGRDHLAPELYEWAKDASPQSPHIFWLTGCLFLQEIYSQIENRLDKPGCDGKSRGKKWQ
ncbi:hypothetical protein C0995_013420, partial [Termitomyces sp. Mi166